MINQEVISKYKNIPEGFKEEETDLFNNLVRGQVELQYIYLKNLGIDYINQYIVDDNIYVDLIEFINDTYISIVNAQTFFDNAVQLQIVGKSIYEIFCVDMVNEIIPKLLKFLKLQDSTEIGLLSNSFIKNGLFNIGKTRLDILQKIYDINKLDIIRYQIIKNGLFIDIIDSDIESFLENFIFPISEIYASVFYSKIPYNK